VKAARHVALLLVCVLALGACAAGAPPGPNKFIVFFPYNETALTPEMRAIVDKAAARAQALKAAHVQLAGYIGNGPTARTDKGLTEKRFAAVEEALAADGIDAKLFLRTPLLDETALPATAVRRVEIYVIAP
jgi:hypothetical protein